MLKRLLRITKPEPPESPGQRLMQILSHDLRFGYTPIAFGQLASGWTLQVGPVAYDWHREASTFYRNGSVLMTGLNSAVCSPHPKNAGVWTLQANLQGTPFHCSLHSSSLDRRWPYFESVNRVMAYWQICFVLETYRHPSIARTTPHFLGAVKDQVHGLDLQSYVHSTPDGRCLVDCQLLHSQRSMGVWLDLTKPLNLQEGSDVFLQHIKIAVKTAPPEAVSLKEHFWQVLVDEANRFADLHSTRWAVRQIPT